jgi:hypothetical protein
MRTPLGQICSVPERIISVYSLEKHIWFDNNSLPSIKTRKPELKTIEEFEIDPVRHFLMIFYALWHFYIAENKTIHCVRDTGFKLNSDRGKFILSASLVLFVGSADAWEMIRQKEEAQ